MPAVHSLWTGKGIEIIMTILNEIAAKTKERVAQLKQEKPLEQIREKALAMNSDTGFPFEKAIAAPGLSFICEVKKASPSKGVIAEEFPYIEIAGDYEKGGARAISVLTEPYWFQGSDTYLKEIREAVSIPIIRKDFVVDEFMIYEAKLMGADAVLLIAAALRKEQCSMLAAKAHELKLEVLLEIHSEQELEYIEDNIDMVGVNNRNLGTFHTDVENSFRLAEKLPKEMLLVSESGISSPQTVRQLRAAGFRGFLIGENFMKTPQPGNALKEFISKL